MHKGVNKPLPISPRTLRGFQNVHLGDYHQQSNDRLQFEHSQVGKKPLRRRWWILLIMLAIAISVLVTWVVSTATSEKCEAPSSIVAKQDTIAKSLVTAKDMTTKNIARRTHITRRATPGPQATPTDLSAPTLTLCLDVLEDVCAMRESRDLSTFADCEPLYVYLYCPLTDAAVHDDAMQTSSSVVCPAMKAFCEKSLHVNNGLRH
jgi:hypothetical protein